MDEVLIFLVTRIGHEDDEIKRLKREGNYKGICRCLDTIESYYKVAEEKLNISRSKINEYVEGVDWEW